jgi:hypothetical protein
LPQPCLTEGCHNLVVNNRSFYCPACRHARHLAQQKHYRDVVKTLDTDLPPEPPTNLKWLDKFSGWAKSGMSYAEYQIHSAENRSKSASRQRRKKA